MLVIWRGTHSENMRESSSTLPEGTQRRKYGDNGSLYEKRKMVSGF